MNIDFKQIKELIQLLEKSELSELTLSQADQSICLKKARPVVAAEMPQVIPIQASQPVAPQKPEIVEQAMKGHVLKSPMVGTYYASPSPTAKPFVTVGSTVKAGDTLCIVEAMKMMNRIVAEHAGTVTQISLKDGSPVEFDQPLMVIE